jgi:hypothetical protein
MANGDDPTLHPHATAPVINIAHLRKFHELRRSGSTAGGRSFFRSDAIVARQRPVAPELTASSVFSIVSYIDLRLLPRWMQIRPIAVVSVAVSVTESSVTLPPNFTVAPCQNPKYPPCLLMRRSGRVASHASRAWKFNGLPRLDPDSSTGPCDAPNAAISVRRRSPPIP